VKENRKLVISLLALTVLLNFAIHVNGTPQVTLNSSVPVFQEFNLVELGQIVTGGIAYDVQVVDNIAYVADGRLVLIDVSDPENPREISSFQDGEGSPEDIYISDDLAYVADGIDGLEIIDISDPSNPVEVGSFNDGGHAHSVSLIGKYAFVADGEDGLEVIDVNDPENPVEVAQYYLSGYYMDIFLADGQAFIANRVITDGRLQYSDLTILNVSDINNIVETGSIDPGYGKSVHYSHVSGSTGYYTTHGLQFTIKILDLSDFSDLREVGRYTYREGGDRGIPNKMDAVDDIVYIACGEGGLRVLNVSDPSNPVEIAGYYDGGLAYDVQVIGNLAFLADRLDGLEIIQLYEIIDGSSSSQSTGTSSFKSTGDAIIPGYEFPMVFSILLSCFYLKKREKKEYL
jgi:hypothetical protein